MKTALYLVVSVNGYKTNVVFVSIPLLQHSYKPQRVVVKGCILV